MIKLENYEVLGWEHAIRGARNAMNSWDRSDSTYRVNVEAVGVEYSYSVNPNGEPMTRYVPVDALSIGPNDHDLMMRLRNAGTDHRKYMRMIVVYVDIIAPLYWWKEFDTYKVGTVSNSCSTMHKIHDKEFVPTDFSCERLNERSWPVFKATLDELNYNRDKFLKTKDMAYWEQMIQLLPSSYNQRRTIEMNYEVLANMYKSRRHHKLDEWRKLCDWIETLPYSEIITGDKKEP